jgi:hypothetical protein
VVRPLLTLSTLMLAFTLLGCNQGPNQVTAAPCGFVPMAPTTGYFPLQATSQTMPSAADVVQGIRTEGNELNITAFNRSTTQDCGNGKNANINGFGDYVTLTGSCNEVSLNGWGNTIHIEETASINVAGDSNTIIWELGRDMHRPAMQIDGMYNSVRHLDNCEPLSSIFGRLAIHPKSSPANCLDDMPRSAKYRRSASTHALPNSPSAGLSNK